MGNHLQNGRGATFRSRALSMLLAIVMLVSMAVTVPLTAWADPDEMEEAISDRLDEVYCIAHGKLDLQFGNAGVLTESNLNAVLTDIFGYEAAIDSFDYSSIRSSYEGAGDGDSLWYDEACVTFTDPDTGDEYDAVINLSIRKCLFAAYTGAVATGALSVCPDEWSDEINDALDAVADYGDSVEVELPFSDYTAANVEEYFRGVTGLGDDWTYATAKFGDEDPATGDYVQVAFTNDNVNDEGRTFSVTFEVILKTPAPAGPDPMIEEIDERYEELACVAHGLLDLVFGTSGTLDSLPDVLTDIFGYPASMDPDDIEDIRSDYSGLGDGQTAWPGEYTVTFTNPDTGAEYDIDIDFALYKTPAGKYCGAIVDRGFLGCCPDDWPAEARNAKLAIDNNNNITAPDFWDDGDVFTIPGDEYTEAAIEAWYRDVTGLGDDWDFYIEDFDADKAYDGNEVHIGLRNDNVNDEGRTVIIACGPTLKIEAAVEDPMPEAVEERYEELQCVAHGDLNLIFGTSGTLTTETLGALLTEIFGYPAEVSQDDVDYIKNAGGAYYGGLGDGQTAGADEIEVTFTNPDLGTTYVAYFDLAIYKGVTGTYCGAIDGRGYLSVCPDEWPEDVAAARDAIDDAHNSGAPDFWNSDDVFTLEGDEYTEAAIEAWFRGVTGLTGDDWTFFIANFDADQAYEGNAVRIGLRNDNINDEGRTFVISCTPTLKIEAAVEDPMPAAIEELYEDLQCIAHNDLNLIFGTSGTITTDTFGALMTEIFGYPAAIEQSEIDRIKGDYGGLGDGQTAGADAVEVTFTNPELGTTYVAHFDLALYKGVYAAYSGAINGRGYLSVCPDEWPDDVVAARDAIDDAHNPGAPDFWNSDDVFTIDGDEYTEAAIEAWFRGVTGLTGDEWTFYIEDFDADQGYDGDSLAIGLRCDDVNGEGRTFVIACHPTLKIEEPAEPDPMIEEIDERFEELACVAHSKLDLAFGTSGTLDKIGDVLTGIFGYTAEVSADEIQRIKNEYGGLGGGQTAWVDAVEVTFTNPDTGAEYTKEMDLAVLKNLFGKYSGAVSDDEAGTLTVCPDELPADVNAALATVAPFNDEYEITLEGDEYSEEVIEAYFRELLGLGDDWTFYINWFDADKAYEGNDVAIGFRNDDVNGEGRTYVIGFEVVLKIEEPAGYLPGDINGDGEVDARDLVRYMKYLAGEDVYVVEEALDCNGDGSVNSKDLTRLMKYLSGETTEIY
ncbi:MAG: hypothetical protein II503_01865 [Clostridia bacterium]|nr:hypothetical protein [Clostridia bacterium]